MKKRAAHAYVFELEEAEVADGDDELHQLHLLRPHQIHGGAATTAAPYPSISSQILIRRLFDWEEEVFQPNRIESIEVLRWWLIEIWREAKEEETKRWHLLFTHVRKINDASGLEKKYQLQLRGEK